MAESKSGKAKPGARPAIDGTAPPDPDPAGRPQPFAENPVQAAIMRQLKTLYDAAAEQPLPQHYLDLLNPPGRPKPH